NLASINNFIEEEKDEENKSENNNIYDDDLLTCANLILEETVNLKDLIFQDRDFIPYEASLNTPGDTSNNNSESNTNIDFNPKSLVDMILNNLED
ncbi:22153_t:CDS:1, partial [Racocetra persica]